MLMKATVLALMGLAAVSEASTAHRTPFRIARRDLIVERQNRANRGGNNAGAANNAGGGGASETCLAASALQTGSFSTGQQNNVAANGQSNSQTDKANFINHCANKLLTNGLQQKQGSCNGIPMGDIPATTAMVSTVITNPKLNDNIPELTTFNIELNVANMQLGSFTNATSTYYSAPQELSAGGTIIGHTHVTVQNVGNSFQFNTPLDARQFVFFKGINDAGNGQGALTTPVTGGLPAGNYRVCSMSGASNHQPVLMPVAQRGAQDDCRYFTVSKGNGGGNNGGNANNGNANGNGNNANTGNGAGAGAGTGNAAASSSVAASSVASSSSAAQASSTAKTGGGRKGTGGGRFGGGRFGGGAKANAGGNGQAAASSPAASSAAAATTASAATSAAASATKAATSTGGALGGIAAPQVQNSGDKTRPFSVNGNTFVTKAAAQQRACAIQNNQCADAVNGGKLQGVTVGDCNAQENKCNGGA